MANKELFAAAAATFIINEAGGTAIALSNKQALAQLAATGCLSDTFYTSAKTQLDSVLTLSKGVDSAFLAKTAIYSRRHSFMKDMPALLLAIIASRKTEADGIILGQVFDSVCDNAKLVRNFTQIVRSGVTGRKSLGTKPKRLVSNWLTNRSDDAVFRASVGNNPSLADVIKLTHPKANTPERNALYGYLIGKEHNTNDLPALVKEFEAFKKEPTARNVPNVPFEMLTALPLSNQVWAEIAKNMSWTQIRMNLNTFVRHGVFENPEMVDFIANKLASPEEVMKAKVFPYQIMAAWMNATDIPAKITNALQQAMEIATMNVPTFGCKTLLFPDVSGSMGNPITGRSGAPSKITCLDVAALMTACIVRRNPTATVVPFDTAVHNVAFDQKQSVMRNSNVLRRFNGGGTACSVALANANENGTKADLVIYISDNQSNLDSTRYDRNSTATMAEWKKFKKNNPNAKLVNIDIQPYTTTQTGSAAKDILNIGGFSDVVFEVISKFISNNGSKDYWVNHIETSIEL